MRLCHQRWGEGPGGGRNRPCGVNITPPSVQTRKLPAGEGLRLGLIPDPLTLDGPVSSLPLDVMCIWTSDLCSEAEAPAFLGEVVTEKRRQPHRPLNPPLCTPDAKALPARALGHTKAAARGPWRPGCCHGTRILPARVPLVPWPRRGCSAQSMPPARQRQTRPCNPPSRSSL